MARVTVEDCILLVPNRFDLVMLSAQRAREIAAGGALTVDRDNDKNPVVALREIAERTVDVAQLEDSVITGLQKHVLNDDISEDQTDEAEDTGVLMAEEGAVAVTEEEPAEEADESENEGGTTESPGEFEDVEDAED